MVRSSVKSAERYRNPCKRNESGSEVNGVSYRSGVYKMYMARMTGTSDKTANVRVYISAAYKCADCFHMVTVG